MDKSTHSQFSLYMEKDRRTYVDRYNVFGDVGWMMEVRQPPGSYGSPACSEFVLVQPQSPGIDLKKVWADARFDGIAPVHSLWLVPAGATTELTVRTSHTIRMLGLSVEGLSSGADAANGSNFGRLEAGPFLDASVAGLMTALWRLAHFGGDETRLLSDQLITEVGAALVRLAGRPRRHHGGGLTPHQVRKTVERLDNGPCTLGELASFVGLSPFHFSRAFRQSLGVSPHRFQKLMRLQKARDLLASTSARVIDVALAVGYESGQALARLFREELGVSPEEFRRLRRA